MKGRSRIPFRIQNIVATTKLADCFRIKDLYEREPLRSIAVRNAYGLSFRVGRNNRYITLYPNGKALAVGCHSIEEAKKTLLEVRKLLSSIVATLNADAEIEIHNVVATSEVSKTLNLDSVMQSLPQSRVEYEPEQFPGVIYRMESPRVAVLIFRSGKVVCTGARRLEDVAACLENVCAELKTAGLI